MMLLDMACAIVWAIAQQLLVEVAMGRMDGKVARRDVVPANAGSCLR